MKTFRRAVLHRRPTTADDLGEIRIERAERPPVEQGCFLVKLHSLSVDVAMRGWMLDGHSYVAPIDIGGVLRACGVGEVLESRHAGFAAGDVVLGAFGAQELAVCDGDGAVRVSLAHAPIERWAGCLGLTTAMTAYLGLTKVGKPKRGQTLLVSGASGAVGSIVGQIGRLKGCKVVGIAGGPEKCSQVVEDLGFDHCLDYRSTEFAADLLAAAPERYDLFFDNVGGEVLDQALTWMKPHGRVVLCGTTAARTTGKPGVITSVRSLIVDRLTVMGFVLFDHAAHYGEAVTKLGTWHQGGRLKFLATEDIRETGLGGLPSALLDVLEGKMSGKVVLKL